MHFAIPRAGGRFGALRFASTPVALIAILAAAFIVRLTFIPADGFSSDVSTFEAWSLLLAKYPTREFFAHASFADYPPGYFFILWIVGHVDAATGAVVPDGSGQILRALVKLPAIVMDLVDAWLIFAIVDRYASRTAALLGAAVFAFDPAIVFVSAYWGQVDSVAAGFALLAVLGMLRAHDAGTRAGAWIAWAWVSLAYSLLIKPPAAVLIPLFVAFAFAGGRGATRRRTIATAIGIAAGLVLAYACAFAFHDGTNPIAQFSWLLGRYEYASSLYPFDSVNAFDLYAVFLHFWEPDNVLLPSLTIAGHVAGISRAVWGLVLLGVAAALIVSRYRQRKDAVAFLEAAMLLSLAFFVLSTRMHERYSFNALALAVPLAFYRPRYLYATAILTLTLFANMLYSLFYLKVMSAHLPGYDATDLMPLVSRPLAALNVVTFFALGWRYLGDERSAEGARALGRHLRSWLARLFDGSRDWFSPIEGVARMGRRDWGIATALTLASFALSFAGYAWPSEKYFDEVYYPRAGEEYLTHANVNGFGVFEFTHPPLTKLLITLSMILFGGMPRGDNAAGWRFLNLAVGALMVFLCYAFAKRLTASTLFASLAAGFVLFDGFHYVQSRIATPEITVAFLSLSTLYCFYRMWIAAQVRVAPVFDASLAKREALVLAAATPIALALAAMVTELGTHQPLRAFALAFAYFETGAYLVARLLTPHVLGAATALRVSFADGGEAGPSRAADGSPGAAAPRGKARKAGAAAGVYATPLGSATFARDAAGGAAMRVTFAGDAGLAIEPVDARIEASESQRWMWLLALSAGCLAASKWNGLFDFFVVWICAFAVASQPWWARIATAFSPGAKAVESARPAVWGNPLGISLDVLVATMLFTGMTIYALSYIPFFLLGKNLDDLIGLQQQMYWYHAGLKATHIYGSSWWQWPLLLRPIAYYYHDFRTGAAMRDPAACCVAEILALPNPVTWWTGLLSVPLLAVLAIRERSKGFTLLVVAYVLQWLPWIVSPRVAFEYHFFPNLAIVCIADAVLLQRVWNLASSGSPWPRRLVFGYAALAVASFAFFYPVLAGTHVPWNVWDARMLHALMENRWV